MWILRFEAIHNVLYGISLFDECARMATVGIWSMVSCSGSLVCIVGRVVSSVTLVVVVVITGRIWSNFVRNSS